MTFFKTGFLDRVHRDHNYPLFNNPRHDGIILGCIILGCTACPSETFGTAYGARSFTVCGPCPAGMDCRWPSTFPELSIRYVYDDAVLSGNYSDISDFLFLQLLDPVVPNLNPGFWVTPNTNSDSSVLPHTVMGFKNDTVILGFRFLTTSNTQVSCSLSCLTFPPGMCMNASTVRRV